MSFTPYFLTQESADTDALVASLADQLADLSVEALQSRVWIVLSHAAAYLDAGAVSWLVDGLPSLGGKFETAFTKLQTCEFGAYPDAVAALVHAYCLESEARFRVGKAQQLRQFRNLEAEFALADAFERRLSPDAATTLLALYPCQMARLRGEFVWLSGWNKPNIFQRKRLAQLERWVKDGSL